MPIIVGAPRSGTTLLRFMLDSHPDMAIPPETGFLMEGKNLKGSDDDSREKFFHTVTAYPPEAPNWKDFQIPKEIFYERLLELHPFSTTEGFRLFYQMYAERFNKKLWGDKTPLYCNNLNEIEELLPEARFIHLIRDGRDVAVSLRKQWFSPGHDIEIQAQYWLNNVQTARSQGKRRKHYLEIRYEDLLQNPEKILKQVCNFIGLEFSEDMLRYYERTPQRLKEHLGRFGKDGKVVVSQEARLKQQEETQNPPDLAQIGTWKKELSIKDQQKFKEIAGDLLKELGYE